jgi:hypothetical protein
MLSPVGFASVFQRSVVCHGVAALFLAAGAAAASVIRYPLEVFPSECKRMTDPKTGTELLFLTTAEEEDMNLFFHEYSWLADESVILLMSSRPKGGLMGYLTTTGELVACCGQRRRTVDCGGQLAWRHHVIRGQDDPPAAADLGPPRLWAGRPPACGLGSDGEESGFRLELAGEPGCVRGHDSRCLAGSGQCEP